MVTVPPNSPSLKRGIANKIVIPPMLTVKKPREANHAKLRNSRRLMPPSFTTASESWTTASLAIIFSLLSMASFVKYVLDAPLRHLPGKIN
jgi:hypothetical protein